jgi:hypothetical protein
VDDVQYSKLYGVSHSFLGYTNQPPKARPIPHKTCKLGFTTKTAYILLRLIYPPEQIENKNIIYLIPIIINIIHTILSIL